MIGNIVAGTFSAGVAPVTSSYESIATTLLTGTQSSVTFTESGSAWADYKHLQIRVLARGTQNDDQDAAYIKFNSDGGSNYAMHYLNGDGSSAGAYGQGSSAPAYPMYMFFFPAANAGANQFGAGICDVLDFSNTSKTKVARGLTGADRNGAGRIYFQSALWNSTSAITSITIQPMNGSFAANSHFALYGIKG